MITGRHARVATDRRRPLAAWTLGVVMLAGVLAGCSEGTSQDAERGQEQDAQRTSVVSDLQATRAARILEPGTPPPPTATTAP